MAEMPIMFYNLDHYKKAGMNPAKPARTWSELQAELLKLRDVAKVSCPYATSDQVAVHVENLAPINNQMFLSNKKRSGKCQDGAGHAVRYAVHAPLVLDGELEALGSVYREFERS